MRRNDAGEIMTAKRYGTAVAAGCTALLLLSGCAGADAPGGGEPSQSPEAGTAPAAESSCADGVAFGWQGGPASEDMFTAVKVVRVKDGAKKVREEWNRGEAAAAAPSSDATEEQQAMVRDVVAGGLVDITEAPEIANSDQLLVGMEKGDYVLYAYAEHTTGSATVSCADGSEAVDVQVATFEEIDTGVANCESTPDPVSEYIVADAVGYCDRV